ncbi:hypothetical protein CPB85DRAFT_1296744, partial [Mucidula mucida]
MVTTREADGDTKVLDLLSAMAFVDGMVFIGQGWPWFSLGNDIGLAGFHRVSLLHVIVSPIVASAVAPI